MKKQWSGYLETAKTMVMLLLFACVLVLLAVYIALLSDTWSTEENYGNIVDEIRVLASGGDINDYPTGDYLLPESITLLTEGSSRALLQSVNGTMSSYYAKAAALLATVASDTDRFAARRGAEATARWEAVTELNSCLYLSYHSDLPLQVIGYFAAAFSENSLCVESSVPVLVKEMVLYEDADGKHHAMIRSSTGTVYTCDNWSDPARIADLYGYSVYEMEKIATTDSAFVDCAMAGTHFGETNPMDSQATPVLLSGLSTAKFRFSTPALDQLVHSKKDTNTFLRLFNYNPNKINRHEEANGTTVYVEEHGMLKVSTASVSYTAAQNGGIPAAEVLGIAASRIDLYDAILYSTRILDGLRAIRLTYFGGDCNVILHSVSGRAGELELRYRYYADNLELRGQPQEIVFQFASDTLVSARIDGLTGYDVADADHMYSGAWVAERFYSSLGPIQSMAIVYDYQTGVSVSAQWTAVSKEGNS